MRALFLDAYFEPEQTAFTHLENDLLEGLTEVGHEVEVVCPTPTRGVSKEVAREYRDRRSEHLCNGRVHVTRFWAPREGRNPVVRALRYFWCNLRTYQIGKKAPAIDVVFANSTPPTQGWIAGKVAKKLHASFVYSLQDIFPDSLVNAGMAKRGGLLWKVGRRLEDATYKCADRIIVISETFRSNITAKSVPQEKIRVVPNWIDTDLVRPISREDNKLFDEYDIDRSKYIVLYAGNFGASQGADVVLKAAVLLGDRDDIQFVIFGGGSEFKAAKAFVEEQNLANVFIHPLLPQDRVAEVYSMGDVALITCKPGVGNAGMPSKVWSILACNTPIVASFDADSELARVFETCGMGTCVNPGKADVLANGILLMLGKTKLPSQGRSFVKSHAEKMLCVNGYIEAVVNA